MLVDLAGNENLQQSAATEATAAEANSINLSLIQFQTVLRDLAGGKKPTFSGSKLTELMKSAFRKKPKVLMLAHISLDPQYYFQTKVTLNFAQEAKALELGAKPRSANAHLAQKNAPKINHQSQAAAGRSTEEARSLAGASRGIAAGTQRVAGNPVAGTQNTQHPNTARGNAPPDIDPFAPYGGARRKIPQGPKPRGGKK